jgi:hypothetical protein
MAVPTITSISPAVVFTGGQMVTITGTNFRTAYPPPSPSSTGVLPTPPPSMTVTIAGRAAKRVRVLSSTGLTCILNPLDPSAAVSVTLQNLDSAGVAIAGETVTRTNLLQARRADLAIEADLTRLERTLMLELSRQVIANVLKTAAVDYDGTPGGVFDIPDVSKLPALAIQGPHIVDNRPYDLDVGLVTDDGTNFVQRRIFKTINLTYRFVAMDNKQVRNMNLLTLMLQFLQNNPFLEVLRDDADPSKGYLQFELAQVGEFTTFTGSSSADIRGFSGSLVIRGFQVEDVAGFVDQTVAERGRTVDTVNAEPATFFAPSND